MIYFEERAACREITRGQPMKRALEAFGRTVAQTYLAAVAITVYAFPVIFVIAMWALVGYALAFIMDGLGVSRALGKGVLVVVFGIGFGVALFFSVYVWPRVSEVIGKIFDLIGEAASEAGTTASRKKKALIDCDPRELDLEMLTFLQSSVMAKLLLVNNELIRRYSGLGKVALEMDNNDQYLRAFFAAVDRCRQMNSILNVALAEVMPKKST
jgi:hypothetical protein